MASASSNVGDLVSQVPFQTPGNSRAPLERIPFDVFSHVLPYLEYAEAGTLRCVSRCINGKVIQEIHYNEDRAIQIFIEVLITRIERDKQQEEDQKAITGLKIKLKSCLPDSINLREIKKNTIGIMREIFWITKPLSSKNPEILKGIGLPRFMRGLPRFICVQEWIERADTTHPDYCSDILRDLIQICAFKEAVWFASTYCRRNNEALSRLCEGLVRAGEYYEAFNVATHIHSSDDRNWALYNISQSWVKDGDFDKAIEVARQISNHHKALAFGGILTALVIKGEKQRALEIAHSISGVDQKNEVFSNTSSALARRGDFEQSLEMARLISDNWWYSGSTSTRDYAFLNICEELAKRGEFQQSLEIVDSISDRDKKDDAFSSISWNLVIASDGDRACQVASCISKTYKKDEAFLNICEELAKRGEFQQSLEIVDSISDRYKKDLAFLCICKKLAQAGQLEKAGEVFCLIEDSYPRSQAISIVSSIFGLC